MKYPVKAIGKHFRLKDKRGWSEQYICASFVLPKNCYYPEYGVNFRYVRSGYVEGASYVCFLTAQDAENFATNVLYDSTLTPYLSQITNAELIQIDSTGKNPAYLIKSYCEEYLAKRGKDKFPENVYNSMMSNSQAVVNPFYKDTSVEVSDNEKLVLDNFIKPLNNKYFELNTGLFSQAKKLTAKSKDIDTDDFSFKLNIQLSCAKSYFNLEIEPIFVIKFDSANQSTLPKPFVLADYYKICDLFDILYKPATSCVLPTMFSCTNYPRSADSVEMNPRFDADNNPVGQWVYIKFTWSKDSNKSANKLKSTADMILDYLDYIQSPAFNNAVKKYRAELLDGQKIVKYTF